jgi:hypothetical protein
MQKAQLAISLQKCQRKTFVDPTNAEQMQLEANPFSRDATFSE